MVVLGFEPGTESPAERLQRVFGIDAATAGALLSRLPTTVQRGVSRVRAEYFRRALDAIGAQVEIQGVGGALIPPPAPVAPAAPVTPASAQPQPMPRRVSVRPSAPTLHAMPAAVVAPIPAAPVPVFSWGDPSDGGAPGSGYIDANSATLAQHGAPQLASAVAAQAPARPSQPTVGPRASNATLREAVPAPSRAPAALGGLPSLDVPLRAPPTAIGGSAPALRGGASIGAASGARLQPVPPAPASGPPVTPAWGAPAAFQPANIPAPRPAAVAPPPLSPPWHDPSGVFDPPPPPRNQPVSLPPPPSAHAGGFSLEGNVPLPSSRPVAPLEPARPPPLELDFANAAPVRFDPLAGFGGGAVPVGGFGLSLDGAGDALAAPALQPWEQPDESSMAEPVAPSSRPPTPRRRPAPREAVSRPPAGASGRAALGRDTIATRPSGAAGPLPGAASPFSVPPRPAMATPTRPQVGIADRDEANARSLTVDARSFWESLGSAFALPFSGVGPYWVFAIGAWSVAVGVLGLLSSFMFLLGMVVMFVANSSLLAFACDYYRICLWQPMVGEDAVDIAPSFDAALLLNRYLRGGMHFSLFFIATQLPVVAWFTMSLLDGEFLLDLLTDPLGWLLFAFPYLYWPMGVAIASLANSSASVWNVLAGLRAIARAPIEYAFIVFVGLGVLTVSWTVLMLFGSLFGAAGAVLSGTAGIPLALSHGIQGALMGHLARSRSEIFE